MNDSPLRFVSTAADLRAALDGDRRAGRRIGLVPTMGALHEGHLSLVRASKAECAVTVVSIYVNPSQFGPGEDLAKYPRPLETDLQKLAGCQADLVLVPGDAEVYAPRHDTWVEVGAVAEPLEGQVRRGHFRGVATIVLKLFNMVQPQVAYFGQKDYQQTLVVRRMVADLSVPVEIRVCPTVREPDGLAMSSRNAYLSPDARRRAAAIWKSLEAARQLVARGQRDAETIVRAMRETILSAGDAEIDYAVLVDPETLQPVQTVSDRTLAAVAVRIDGTRLIDNDMLPSPFGRGTRERVPGGEGTEKTHKRDESSFGQPPSP